jgi:hypothetical protein
MIELPIPPATTTDPAAVEILRVWAAHGSQHVSLASGLWENPASWGVMLVDLAKHVANAYSFSRGLDIEKTLGAIRVGFEAEWNHGTDIPHGELL